MVPSSAKEQNARQLVALRELADTLGAARIRFWLRGGWALDFHLGRITRTHSDLDLVTWRRHRERIRRLLEPRGFVSQPVEVPDTQLLLVRRVVEVNFALVERDRRGRIVSRALERWPWPEGTLAAPEHELCGIRCRAMSPRALLAEKRAAYYRDRGLRPRAKDNEDIRILRKLVESPPGSSG